MNQEAAYLCYNPESDPDSVLTVPRDTAATGKQLQNQS
jgi:hypothetical protein